MRRPYRVGYWNAGQRKTAELVKAWDGLLAGKYTDGHELAALHLSEVADQGPALAVMQRWGYVLVTGTAATPDGRKEAILFNPDRVELLNGPVLHKIGDAFQGRRAGRTRRVRMANKYLLTQEVRDLRTGWTPIHVVSHVWPSVRLNAGKVYAAELEAEKALNDMRGTVLFSRDQNMRSDDRLMGAVARTGLVSAQLRYGPRPTFGRRKLNRQYDDWWAREGDHYRVTGSRVVTMPGRESRLVKGHAAVILEGEFTVRAGFE